MAHKINPENVLRRAIAELMAERLVLLECNAMPPKFERKTLPPSARTHVNRLDVLLADLAILREQLKSKGKRK